jgi:hypothetical protein
LLGLQFHFYSIVIGLIFLKISGRIAALPYILRTKHLRNGRTRVAAETIVAREMCDGTGHNEAKNMEMENP